MQAGYAPQWGAKGRDDLGVMSSLGANMVRTYHELGHAEDVDHGAFLDYASDLGLNVMPGYHTEKAQYPGQCPEWDCFETWKDMTLTGFKQGFQKGDSWHPAVAALVLLNEPDFFWTSPKCNPMGAWCHLKAALSALDGVLAAEKEMGINGDGVRLTVAWSFAMRKSIDGKVVAPGLFGFQDMMVGVQNPKIVDYTPRSNLQEFQKAFRDRWVNCLNTQAPWTFVRDMVSGGYDQFLPTPWFIGEYGANGQEEALIRSDLESMQKKALEKDSPFLGAAVFQFETAYWKGGSEMNFGLFGLQDKAVGQAKLCNKRRCRDWPVHCLTPTLSFLPGSMGHRAAAVAAAWGGRVDVTRGALCQKAGRRKGKGKGSTKLACSLQLADADLAPARAALGSADFAAELSAKTLAILGEDMAPAADDQGLARFSLVAKPLP